MPFAARLLLLSAALFATGAAAETRVALVIGEGEYRSAPTLANPPNDARDVAQVLRTLGFEATLAVNLDQAGLKEAVAQFAARARNADLALFYYGGHGLQVSQRNYLVPVDAQMKTAADIQRQTVPLDSVIDALSGAKGQRLVFLDACRENPLKRDNALPGPPGLASVGKAAGQLIAFATQPDAVAFDGAGRNSPFAQGLLAHLPKPGVDLSNMLIAVRRDVLAATGGEQAPWENSSLTQQVYLAGEGRADASPEAQLWRLAAPNRDPDLLKVYLDRYPLGPHAGDARAALASPATAPPKPKESGAEEEIWRLALSTREPSLVDLYRARYPQGAHAKDAEELADRLAAAAAAAKDPGTLCDRLATHPHDATAAAPGVELATLAAQSGAAIDACQRAISAAPQSAHYEALLARSFVAARRYDEAIKHFRAAAEAGDARAMWSLGRLMETGDHVAKDVAGAYALYAKAAERGLADGAIDYAVALVQGKVMPKDVNRAHSLMKGAADAGSAIATFNLAKLAEDGLAGQPSEALALYRRAAALGEPNGYRAAAVLLDEGRGVKKDPEGAAEELLRAVTADSGGALAELTGAAQTWTPATVTAVQKRLKTAGYYTGAADGRSGPALAPALKRWRLTGDPAQAAGLSRSGGFRRGG